jgi:sugar lactone lactonase YvrE
MLQVPESVLYHPPESILYVSNVAGKPTVKNGQGFISKLTLEGRIEELKWATGLNAPKGLAVYGAHLYVSDIDELVQIELKTGSIAARYPAAGAVFLNDVAADAAGNIYVGDSSAEHGVIYRLQQGRLEAWLQAPEIQRPNGLYMQGERLLVGHAREGDLHAVDLQSRKITPLAKGDFGIDGLQPIGRDRYLVSDWAGKTSVLDTSGKTIVLMDTSGDGINAADFEYIAERQLLIIPTFFDNRVMAYTVQ